MPARSLFDDAGWLERARGFVENVARISGAHIWESQLPSGV